MITLLGQVALLRELSVAFQGSELIYLLALGGWLLGSGLGALPGSRRGDSPSPTSIRTAFLVFAVLAPASAAGARVTRVLLDAVPGAYLPLDHQLLAMAAVLLPISMLSGMLFRITAQAWLGPGRSLARAYGFESLGAFSQAFRQFAGETPSAFKQRVVEG